MRFLIKQNIVLRMLLLLSWWLAGPINLQVGARAAPTSIDSFALSHAISRSGMGDQVPMVQSGVYSHTIFLPFLSGNPCDHRIGLDVSIADNRTDYAAVSPGDTVCVMAGTRNRLYLRNFQGTAESPITFVNFGGQVVVHESGILIQNSKYIRLTGSGDSGIEYGFKITSAPANGLTIVNKSSDFEIDHVEITGAPLSGIKVDTPATCSDGSTSDWRVYDYDGDGIEIGDLDDVINRSNFTIHNSVLHDNYVHDVGTEGIYVGSSFYSEGSLLNCASGPERVYDPLLVGVYIYGNRVQDTGWDGIQAGSAIETCDIHHNAIYRDSRANRQSQQSGIMNNSGSICNLYNNLIKDGGGPGMYIQGNGGNRIFNNVIVNAGRNGMGSGIDIDTGTNTGNSIYVWHNTIVRAQSYGIHFNNTVGSSNKIQNNIVVDPGNYPSGDRGNDLDHEDDAFIQTWSNENLVLSNNLLIVDISQAKFTDPAANDYSLQPSSPAVDAGINLSAEGITADYRDLSRPQGSGFDIGAFELDRSR